MAVPRAVTRVVKKARLLVLQMAGRWADSMAAKMDCLMVDWKDPSKVAKTADQRAC